MSYTCPRCGMTSHNPEDERRGYCGNCHDFTWEEPVPEEEPVEKLNRKLKRKHAFRVREGPQSAREDPPQDESGGDR